MTCAHSQVEAALDRWLECHWHIHQMEGNYHYPDPFRYALNSYIRALKEIPQILRMELQNHADYRTYFQPAIVANRDRFAPFMNMAKEVGMTPAQLALAWVLHQGQDIIPIPGTRRPERVTENAKASAIKLDRATLQRINELARSGLAQGATLV